MNRTKRCLPLAMLLFAGTAWGKMVGLWKVTPLYVSDATVETLEEAGWRVVTVGNKDLARQAQGVPALPDAESLL